jgi:alkaline phosphatase D
MKAVNPFVKFHSRERGYARCTVTPKSWTTDFIAVDDVTKPGGKFTTRASFAVESGQKEIHPA